MGWTFGTKLELDLGFRVKIMDSDLGLSQDSVSGNVLGVPLFAD